MGVLLHLVQRGGDWTGPQPAQVPPRCNKCNSPPINGQCTNHTVLLYNGPLLCGFSVGVKGLRRNVNAEKRQRKCVNGKNVKLHAVSGIQYMLHPAHLTFVSP